MSDYVMDVRKYSPSVSEAVIVKYCRVALKEAR